MRARNIKPGYFKNEDLADCDPLTRILFAGLWCMADREGRLEYRPKRIKAEILPYDNCSIPKMLDKLQEKRFILIYPGNDYQYIEIINFKEHQHCHVKETASTIPAPDKTGAKPVQAPDKHQTGTGVKRPHTESPILNTESLLPEPPVDNSEPEYPPFDSIKTEPENKKAAPTEKPKREKPPDPKPDDEFVELRDLVGKVKVKFPKLAIETFLGKNRRAHPESIKHVLRSLIKNGDGLRSEDPLVLMVYLQKSVDIENGKYNARDSEAEHEARKKPIPGEMTRIGDILSMAAKGGANA